MRLVVAAVVLLAGCEQKTDLDRCVDEKLAEYDRLYPDTDSKSRENVRGAHRMFCKQLRK